jgi:FtsH-binding integral membrane protein
MTDETPDPMTNVWKSQPAEPVGISLDDMRRQARTLESRISWRNAREYVACGLVVAAFGYYALVFHDALVRAGCGLVIAGALLVAFRLHTMGAARTIPAELAFRTCLAFRRQELERQRDLLLGVWRWYLLPFVPGMAVFLVGLFAFTMQQPHASEHVREIVAVLGLTAVSCALVFVGIAKLNHWAARKLQREIDALDRLVREP